MDPQTEWIYHLQMNSADLNPVFQVFSSLGLPEFYLMVIPLICWCYRRSLGIQLIMLLSVSGALCDALKMLFHTPRPYWVSTEIRALTNYPSFGFPSGHAQNAVVFFGMIAAGLNKGGVTILCSLIIILTGLARIFQAVHYPVDILGGYVIGIILLILFVRFESPLKIRISRYSPGKQLLLVCAGSCSLILATALAFISLGSWQVPSEWYTLALEQSSSPISPLIPHDTLMCAGLFLGSGAGAVIASRYPLQDNRGSVGKQICRYLVGMLILFAIYVCMKPLMNAAFPIGYSMEYIRSTLIGFWITCGAPLLFKKIGLDT